MSCVASRLEREESIAIVLKSKWRRKESRFERQVSPDTSDIVRLASLQCELLPHNYLFPPLDRTPHAFDAYQNSLRAVANNTQTRICIAHTALNPLQVRVTNPPCCLPLEVIERSGSDAISMLRFKVKLLEWKEKEIKAKSTLLTALWSSDYVAITSREWGQPWRLKCSFVERKLNPIWTSLIFMTRNTFSVFICIREALKNWAKGVHVFPNWN